jgi:hypothetical protein
MRPTAAADLLTLLVDLPSTALSPVAAFSFERHVFQFAGCSALWSNQPRAAAAALFLCGPARFFDSDY